MSASNPRLIPQQSVCMLTNIAKLEDWIYRAERTFKELDGQLGYVYTPHLIKVLLDISQTKTIKKDLHLMGINEMTMFPTVDGVCKFLKEKMFSLGEIRNL